MRREEGETNRPMIKALPRRGKGKGGPRLATGKGRAQETREGSSAANSIAEASIITAGNQGGLAYLRREGWNGVVVCVCGVVVGA